MTVATSNANVLWIITDTASSLFLSCFFPPFLPACPSSPLTCHELRAYVVATPNAKQLIAHLLFFFFSNGSVFISGIISASLILL